MKLLQFPLLRHFNSFPITWIGVRHQNKWEESNFKHLFKPFILDLPSWKTFYINRKLRSSHNGPRCQKVFLYLMKNFIKPDHVSPDHEKAFHSFKRKTFSDVSCSLKTVENLIEKPELIVTSLPLLHPPSRSVELHLKTNL